MVQLGCLLQKSIANRNAIETVVLSREESVKAKMIQIKKDILNDIFWDRIAATRRVIEVVSYYITVVERDTVPSLSVVPYLFNDLKKALLGRRTHSPNAAPGS